MQCRGGVVISTIQRDPKCVGIKTEQLLLESFVFIQRRICFICLFTSTTVLTCKNESLNQLNNDTASTIPVLHVLIPHNC